MLTLFASIIGLLGSALPDIMGAVKRNQDIKYEMEKMHTRAALEQRGMEVKADIAESEALAKTYFTGIGWVDALNGTVRPVIAYFFFFLYAGIKIKMLASGLPWNAWTQEDQAIFAGIISFYFGQRSMNKYREKIYGTDRRSKKAGI